MWHQLSQSQPPASQTIGLQMSHCRTRIHSQSLLIWGGFRIHIDVCGSIALSCVKIFVKNKSDQKTAGMKNEMINTHILRDLYIISMLNTSTYQEWALCRPATSRSGWNLLVGTLASARTRCGCASRPVPWLPLCVSRWLWTSGWGFPQGQSDGRSWQWPWKTWLLQTRIVGSWKREAFFWSYLDHWKAPRENSRNTVCFYLTAIPLKVISSWSSPLFSPLDNI